MQNIPQIVEAIAKENFLLWVKYNDGIEKTVNIRPMIANGVSKALLDAAYFKTVKVENGYICWENGFDICPEHLYNL